MRIAIIAAALAATSCLTQQHPEEPFFASLRWNVECGATTEAQLTKRYVNESVALERELDRLGGCDGRMFVSVSECSAWHAIWRRHYWAREALRACPTRG